MESVQGRANIVNKDMTDRLAIVANKLKEEKTEKEKLQDESDFWSRERKRMQADPNNVGYQTAIAVGKAYAKAFFNSAMNPGDPDHESSWPIFRDVYKKDIDAVEKDFIAKEAAETKTGPFQFRDINYERKIKLRYKKQPMSSLIEAKLFDNFCVALDAKWTKSGTGYNGDKKFIESYCEKYGIEPNMAIDEMAKFQPKP